MAEITQRAGNWYFDGSVLRIVPGHGKGVHALRTALGELTVPLEAVAGVSFEPGRKHDRLRLSLREGADPLTQATGGKLPAAADPYLLEVPHERADAARELAAEIRAALETERVPATPTDHYLLPGPETPITLHASDGEATFDGQRIRIDWGWGADDIKKNSGARVIALGDLASVEWAPPRIENGFVRLHPKGAHSTSKPAHDPNCVVMWGWREVKDVTESALFVAALTAALPHPSTAEGTAAVVPPAVAEPLPPVADGDTGSAQDAVLRRLWELGELHDTGVLTDEEFGAAKKALLNRL
ncbi:DUF4429 domain-containing protein [Streptomyces sp. NPDC059853]|uniref:DUF4429 domain-containing protein n=1 Tax=Streptomyces sp. NPDC059853 TaxID=3346973 RepID=UPI00365214BA